MFKFFHRRSYSRTRLRALWNEWRYRINTARSGAQLQAGEGTNSEAKLQFERAGPGSTTSSNQTSTPVASPLAKGFNSDTSTEGFSSITNESKYNSADLPRPNSKVRTHTYTAWFRQWKHFTRKASLQSKKSTRIERIKSRYRKLFTYKPAAKCEPSSQLPMGAIEPLHIPARNGSSPFSVALSPIFTSPNPPLSSDNVPKMAEGGYDVSDNWASNMDLGGEEKHEKAEEHAITDLARGDDAFLTWFPDTLAMLGESAKFGCFHEMSTQIQPNASSSNPYLNKNLDETPPVLTEEQPIIAQHLSAGSSVLQEITNGSIESERELPMTQCSMRMKRRMLLVQFASQTSLISPSMTSNSAAKSEVKSSQSSGSKRRYLKRAPARIARWFSSAHQRASLKSSPKH